MANLRMTTLLAAGAFLALLAAAPAPARASDHADTAEVVNRKGADMTDVYMFPGRKADGSVNPDTVVLVMDVHGFLMPAEVPTATFDTRVLYQFKITHQPKTVQVEDLVIQVRFLGNRPAINGGQQVLVSGPSKPIFTGGTTVFSGQATRANAAVVGPVNGGDGTTSVFGRALPRVGTTSRTFSPDTAGQIKVFAGPREDPFFFDVERLNTIFPDRATPLTGQLINFPSIMAANTPQRPGFRGFPAGAPGDDSTPAHDTLAGLNVLSVIIELPRAMLAAPGEAPGVIGLWETTSLATGAAGGFKFKQLDRLGRPIVNEGLATTTFNRHLINDQIPPGQDASQIKNDIGFFFNFPAGRSAAITSAVQSVLIPDTLVADLSQPGAAAYLGNETGGATSSTQSTFGGRALTDDVADITLGIIFGNIIPTLGLAPEDGQEKPFFATDNVGDGAKTFTPNAFPYLGNPHVQ